MLERHTVKHHTLSVKLCRGHLVPPVLDSQRRQGRKEKEWRWVGQVMVNSFIYHVWTSKKCFSKTVEQSVTRMELIRKNTMRAYHAQKPLKHLSHSQQVENQHLKTHLTANPISCHKSTYFSDPYTGQHTDECSSFHHFRPRESSCGWRWLRRPWPNSMAPTLPCRQGVPSRAWQHWQGLPVTPSCSRSAPPTPGRNRSTQTSSGPRCSAPKRPGKRGIGGQFFDGYRA